MVYTITLIQFLLVWICIIIFCHCSCYIFSITIFYYFFIILLFFHNFFIILMLEEIIYNILFYNHYIELFYNHYIKFSLFCHAYVQGQNHPIHDWFYTNLQRDLATIQNERNYERFPNQELFESYKFCYF